MKALKTSRRRNWILSPIAVLLLLGLACGAAATPAPQVVEKTVPVPQVVTKEVTKAVVVVATPTPAPTPAPPPSAIERALSSGKVTMMVGGLANERFDHVFALGGSALMYLGLIHGPLISTNEKLDRLPGIASAWRISDDGRTVTFTIRQGVKFHDGAALTTEDVLWTARHTRGPEALAYSQSGLDEIRNMEKIEQTGPDKVSLTSKTSRPYLLLKEGVEPAGNLAAIMPKRPTLHDEEAEAAYDRNPIGAGYMKLVKHVPAFLMAFERFDDYYYQPKNGLPEDKRVNFRWLDLYLVGEVATRVAAVRAGQADIIPANLAVKKQVEAGGGRLVFGREGSYFYLTMRGCFKPEFPCHDKRVRQALNYAIDKELIRDKLYGPEVMQAKGWDAVTPSTIGYSPELDPPPFDPNKARQLLADAGYPGGKGFGKLIINTWVHSSTPLMPEVAQLTADFWRKELGIDAEVKVGDEVAIKKDEKAGKLDGQIMWRDNEVKLDASITLEQGYGNPKGERRAHQNPELYDLYDKAVAVIDPQQREKTFNALYRRLREESYQISMGYVNIPWAVGPRILKWNPYPMSPYPSGMHTMLLK